jgi:hypothetical protein
VLLQRAGQAAQGEEEEAEEEEVAEEAADSVQAPLTSPAKPGRDRETPL